MGRLARILRESVQASVEQLEWTGASSSAGSYASPVSFIGGFGPAIGVAAGLSLVGAIVGLALSKRREAPAPAMIAPMPAIESAA